jgi:hypothetical protein
MFLPIRGMEHRQFILREMHLRAASPESRMAAGQQVQQPLLRDYRSYYTQHLTCIDQTSGILRVPFL